MTRIMNKRELIQAIIAFVFLILFGLFVYPTLYLYRNDGARHYTARINRITGVEQEATAQGWR